MGPIKRNCFFYRFDYSQEIIESIEVNSQLRDFLMPENPGIENLPLPILNFPGNYQIGWKKERLHLIGPIWAFPPTN